MPTRTFLDTNILIYSIDQADPIKREMALGWIAKLAKERVGVISTQVLQEFYSAATRKLGVEPLVARQHVRDFQIFEIVQITATIIEQGIDCSILHRLSFWDALIVAAAATGKCSEILTEDLNDGQIILGAMVRKPF